MFEDLLMTNAAVEESEFMPIISVDEDDEPHTGEDMPELVPVLALKNTVLYPGIVIPITVGREKSMKAVRKAHDTNKQIAVLAQKDVETEDPGVSDLFTVGTMATDPQDPQDAGRFYYRHPPGKVQVQYGPDGCG